MPEETENIVVEGEFAEKEELKPEIKEVSQEVVDRARGMGWIPKDEFRGDKSRWRPADEYVQRGDEMLPIMKAQMAKYEAKINALQGTVDGQRENTEKLLKMSEKMEERSYEKARNDIIKKQSHAIKEGDSAAWESLENEKFNLEKPKPAVEVTPTPQVSPEVQAWQDKNTWYTTDEDMTAVANAHLQNMRRENPGVPMPTILTNLESRVKAAFPHKFENPARDIPAAVDSSSTAPPAESTGKKTYSSLPADAKEQCRMGIESKLFKTKEDYVKSYYAED